ncbi:MAG TPA: GNAT family N-acetyltransferase, partial [Dongiaceae bacterium]
AAQLTQIDYDREMAIVATDAGAASLAEIHGVARIFADPDGERGEFALVVEDSMTQRGIGRLLMQHLIEFAASRGINEIYGDILGDNSPMLALCRRLGFRLGLPGREGVLKVSLDPLHG